MAKDRGGPRHTRSVYIYILANKRSSSVEDCFFLTWLARAGNVGKVGLIASDGVWCVGSRLSAG